MTTLEEVVSERLRRFDEEARALSDDPAALRDLDDRRAAYLVEAAPYIHEYYKDEGPAAGAEAAGTEAAGVSALSRVVGRSNKRDVFASFKYHVDGDDRYRDEVIKPAPCEYLCECGGERVRDPATWDMTCVKCCVTVRVELGGPTTYNDGQVSHTQREGLTYVNHMAYKRPNHFCEWLNCLQGRENKEIPEHVMHSVREELRKNRVTEREDITPLRIRQILKKLNHAAYYDNMHRIAYLVGGPPPLSFSPTLEAQLKTMFVRIQAPFEEVKPPGRKNFLSYSYTIYKFAELLGADEILANLSLLKSAEKLHAQDEIWKKICAVLKWEFIPSGIMTQSNFHKKALDSVL